MASSSRRMSALAQELSTEEGWQNLVAWDGELYDPLFQGEVGIEDTSNRNAYGDSFTSNAAESVTSEQSYIPSITTPSFEGPSSFDYVTSRPASVTGEPSSFDHGHSWLSGFPSYTTSATSPLAIQTGIPNHGSFEACETMLSPGQVPPASPFLDAHSWGSSSSYQTAPTSGLFNPHVSGTPHSFSGLDVYNSQALVNVGTWAEPSVEPLIEVHQEDGSGAMPIPIPYVGTHREGNVFTTHSWNEYQPSYHFQTSQARAITIPQPHRRSVDARSNHLSRVNLERHPSLRRQSQQGFRGVPPILSVSPEHKRVSRTVQLTRSLSNPRRSRNGSLATPPIPADLGWVSYQPDEQQRLKPSGAEGGQRRHKGRTGPLSAQLRSEAAVMRHVGSCSNCRKRKEKCDPGTPCKSCIIHFGSDLVNHPCRERLVSGLARVFLAERHGWHPTARPISGIYQVDAESYSVPIIFGFGSTLHIPVSIVRFEDTMTDLLHEHTIYSWPPNASPSETHTHAVLPATLTPEALSDLETLLDTHLSLLVDQHFSSFPLFCSPLRILRHVYVYTRSLAAPSPHAHLLCQALKLLVLVHVGGDITLPPPHTSPPLAHLVHTTTPSLPQDVTPTPCFLRAQFGAIMPGLALKLMREALVSLEQLFLRRALDEWPVALAAFLVLLMSVESIQYHAAKLPYHHAHDTPLAAQSQSQSSQRERERDFAADDEGVRQLLEFYQACFGACHARLGPNWQGDVDVGARQGSVKSAEDKFVESVREAVRGAGVGYLEAKAREAQEEGDMGFFFDRLVARLLVLDLEGVK
ncbi:hypothetical protein BU23DRAFT_123272 [Bimuria novae-zelandiae CBS 107.79]|uniref:Zn(2)-C6 fungal-type domain-containing protein n=1 Tax=Bimuria novae-zelandiae CBS 107.79 TaxID=1447943 RepID=A0A6A5V9L6_9PLEO|nr:hypothetical protein BU23DRAFT_123272 [Bimuria novae-zelandiae CBS 107.79]